MVVQPGTTTAESVKPERMTFQDYLKRYDSFEGGRTEWLAGVPMYINDTQPAREPDLLVLLNAHLDRIQPTYVEGVADLVVEIVSPESDARDHGDKFIEYEAAGVPEYWLLDPLRRQTDVYLLGDDGRYHRLPPDSQGRMVSNILPGFALDPEIVWRDSLPDVLEVVALVQAMG